MPNILLELFSEEMPADIQVSASKNLKKLITDKFAESGLLFSGATSFSTAQRLCIVIDGLPSNSEAKTEMRRGPKIDAPQKAIDGFVKSLGIKTDELEINEDKKGKYYFAKLIKPAVETRYIASRVIESAIFGLSWSKSMRWGESKLRWVRPLKSILCILSDENGAETIPIDIDGIISSNTTTGHRFMSPSEFTVNSFEEYEKNLRKNFTILDPQERREIIFSDSNNLAFSQGLEVVNDSELLEEVCGLAEWPVVLMGSVAKKYQTLPNEILQTSMKKHQKFFSVKNIKTNKIEKFITVANIEAPDAGEMIIKGNQKVLEARLADGEFFFQNDLRIAKKGGKAWLENLERVIFHNKLGSQADRIERIEGFAVQVGTYFNLTKTKVVKTVRFLKADLSSQMVYEFPELQGVMGSYYAKAAGYDEEISLAILEHYQPLGPSDQVPVSPLSIVVALSEKLELISSFWAINEKPTGSKDPFALRRAGIGIIRLILESGLRINLSKLFTSDVVGQKIPVNDILLFLHERLKFFLIDQGVRYDSIDACLASPENDDFLTLVKRIKALDSFLKTKSGLDLLSGFKRANNILSAEEKKDGVRYELDPDLKFMKEHYEQLLFQSLNKVKIKIKEAMSEENFTDAMSNMAELRGPIDQFFKEVTVNDENQVIRRNRLCLLNSIKEVCCAVAELSRIQESN